MVLNADIITLAIKTRNQEENHGAWNLEAYQIFQSYASRKATSSKNNNVSILSIHILFISSTDFKSISMNDS